MRGAAPEWRKFGCAALLGAIVAFPAGMAFSSREPVQAEAPKARTPSGQPRKAMEGRNPYAPEVLSDAHVIDQHRRTVETMELSCRQTGALCAEAEQARKYLVTREAEGDR
jgi:hypothetical protein